MMRLLPATGLAAVGMVVVSACMAAEAGRGPSGEDEISVRVRAVDSRALPGAIVYLCEAARESRHPPERSEAACRVEPTGVDGTVVFRIVAGSTYSATAVLEGFADTTVFPLAFGPDAEPKAPRVVILVLNAVCYDC